jgi:hypothetical protein
MKRALILAAVLTFPVISVLPERAEAAAILCSNLNVDVTGQVSNTAGCNYSSVFSNDPASAPIEVNIDAFFGFSDWSLAQQGININQKTGTWDVTGFTDFDEYQWLIIFKDGNVAQGVVAPLIGYLAAPGFFSGTWNTPFVANFWATGQPGDDKDVSHISYYYRTPTHTTPVPEPTTLALLGAGLAAAAAARRRRARK